MLIGWSSYGEALCLLWGSSRIFI